jgi:molecular chaperone GrpE
MSEKVNQQETTMEETEQVEQNPQAEEQETIEPIFDENNENSSKEEELTLEEAKEKIASLEKALEEAENRYLRLRADFDNFRRRTNLEKEAAEKYRAQSLISDLLPAIDNFERALQMEPSNEQTKSLLQGMEMVYRSLLEALKKEGVEPIEAVGQPFDPHLHQAVMQANEEGVESNVVVEELQKGYKLKDRVIRPSMVKVNL